MSGISNQPQSFLGSPGPQELVHAQLSPPATRTIDGEFSSAQQQQLPTTGSSRTEDAAHQANTATSQHGAGGRQVFQRLFQGKDPSKDQPNLGFTPSRKMALQHEQDEAQGKQQPKPLYIFSTTKLRSWRTGYSRFLALYADGFATIDPANSQETNRWSYDAFTEYLALPKEPSNILLQVHNDKLKFSCHERPRAQILTALLTCQDRHRPHPQTVVFQQAERMTRIGTKIPVSLHVKPYGILELQNENVVQVYRFMDIRGVSFTPQSEQGILLHFDFKSRLYFIHSSRERGSGRSDLIAAIQQHFELLGLELIMRESFATHQWLEQRRTVPIGTIATSWQVTKASRRHDSNIVGPRGWPGGVCSRHLLITAAGLLVERDDRGIVGYRQLSDIYAIVRYPHSDEVSIEYSDGSTRKYTCGKRDALIVSLLDASSTFSKNYRIHLADSDTQGYALCVHGMIENEVSEKASGIFQPISISSYCLKRVYSISTQTYAFLSGMFFDEGSDPASRGGVNYLDEANSLLEACLQFNASVTPGTEIDFGGSGENRMVLGTIGALWGIIGILLKRRSSGGERQASEEYIANFFQVLYRLSGTEVGYTKSSDLTTLQETLPLMTGIVDPFCRFWSLKVTNRLLSGREKRDLEAEYVNKAMLLRLGGNDFIENLVAGLTDTDKISDLIRMVTSDLLQSLLVSFHDTTAPEHFSGLLGALTRRYRGLLSALNSETPFVTENAALLLHLLATHAPETSAAVREVALGSATLLKHFHASIFSPMEDQRFLSRFLCSLWLSGPPTCSEKRLLRRMVPHGFFAYLKMPLLSLVEEEQLDVIERDRLRENTQDSFSASAVEEGSSIERSFVVPSAGANTARLRQRAAISYSNSERNKQENFRIFFHVLTQDHNIADLIWSRETRRELRIALESEIQYVSREIEARGFDHFAWNHQHFRVNYASLDKEVRVGDIYMRLWLDAGDAFIRSWEEPVRLFENLFRRFLCELDRDKTVTIMCIRCLARLYPIHAGEIGVFNDLIIVVRAMASTKNLETQHRLLELLACILGVHCGESQLVDIPENAEQLLNGESIGQLCQFVAWGHTNGIQIGNVLSRSVGQNIPRITGDPASEVASGASVGPDKMCPPVWYTASTGQLPPPKDLVRGPYRVSDLANMMSEGSLTPYDVVTSSNVEDYEFVEDDQGMKENQIDTGKWRRLEEVWQLRWQLCTDGSSEGILSPSNVSSLSVRVLMRLVELHRSLDSRGVPYYPIPPAKRILSGLDRSMNDMGKSVLNPLAILAQAMLCNDGRIVTEAATLVKKLMEHNEEAVSKLYKTGIFFFGLQYTGSNFLPIADLFFSTHLNQRFRSGYAAAADATELPLRHRSILGDVLPEGLLFILVNYGPVKFAEVFVGDVDSPEVIWTTEMRKHLIEMVHQHLGDFRLRLFQNTTLEYGYCPIPGVSYSRLKNEVFCHNYYLSNLCDENRFPDWPIADPVELFRSCLEKFKRLNTVIDDNIGEEDIELARHELNLKAGDGSKELRRAYRSFARKFHPDRNPEGREKFEKIQQAYELLLPVLDGGEVLGVISESNIVQDDTAYEGLPGGRQESGQVLLLLKTQLLVLKRYEKKMSRFKYPAYDLILIYLRLPPSTPSTFDSGTRTEGISILNPRRLELVKLGLSLVLRTCELSPLNGESLVGEGGVPTLVSLLNFFSSFLLHVKSKGAGNAVGSSIVKDVGGNILMLVRIVSGISFFESGRNAVTSILLDLKFMQLWRRCLQGFPGLSRGQNLLIQRYAAEGVSHLCRESGLQEEIITSGMMWPLLASVLQYDPTVDEGVQAIQDDESPGESMASVNLFARASVRALGSLSGDVPECPPNPSTRTMLERLLTPPISKLLRNKRTGEILKILNSNVERPDIIWNFEMRHQLESFVTSRAQDENLTNKEEELSSLTKFEYSCLSDEVQVDGIYVRVFSKTGTEKDGIKFIEDPTRFGVALISCLGIILGFDSHEFVVEYPAVDSLLWARDFSLNDDRFSGILQATKVLAHSPGVFEDLIGYKMVPRVLMKLIKTPMTQQLDEAALSIFSIASTNPSFAETLSETGNMWQLIFDLATPARGDTESGHSSSQSLQFQQRKAREWSILEGLSSSPAVAEVIVKSSGWIELLGILVGYVHFTKRFTDRVAAAKLLSKLLWDSHAGHSLATSLGLVLPLTLLTRLKDDPEKMVKMFDEDSDNPELIWDASMRTDLRNALAPHLDECYSLHNRGEQYNPFAPDIPVTVRYTSLDKELFLGGVYVSRFLKEPTFQLRDPSQFLEILLQRWNSELDTCTQQDSPVQSSVPKSTEITMATLPDALVLVTDSIVYLCKGQGFLCDKLSDRGILAKALGFLEKMTSEGFLGTPLESTVRILHVSTGRMKNVEALAVCRTASARGLVSLMLSAIGTDDLHKNSDFMIETLLRTYKTALGDVRKAGKARNPTHVGTGIAISMAPSPAPGDESIRERVNKGDDPLGMFSMPEPVPGNSELRNTVIMEQRNQTHTPRGPTTLFMPRSQDNPGIFIGPSSSFSNTLRDTVQATGNQTQPSPHPQNQQMNYHGYLSSAPGAQTQTTFHQQQNASFSGAHSFQSNGAQNFGRVPHTDPNRPSPPSSYSQQQTPPISFSGRSAAMYSSSGMMESQRPTSYAARSASMQSTGTATRPSGPLSYTERSYMHTPGTQPPPFLDRPVPAPSSTPQLYGHFHPATSYGHSAMPNHQNISSQPTSVLPGSQASYYNDRTSSAPAMYGQVRQDQSFGQGYGQVDTGTQQYHPSSEKSSTQPIHTYEQPPRNVPAEQYSGGVPNSSQEPPVVETVQEGNVRSFTPKAVSGDGIDARTAPDPKLSADEQARTVGGAPGAAHGRVGLLEQALESRLCNFVVESFLENPSLVRVKDPASAKVHAIELLKLLRLDPGYGPKFNLILEGIPAWKKYKSQDHSLLITSHEQRADYFLTDGGNSDRKMLTQG